MPASAADPAVGGFARAIVEVARAEGVLDRVETELFAFTRAMQANPKLRDRLVDERVGIGRHEIVDELLERRGHPQTAAAINYVVQGGRARLLHEIADEVTRIAAAERSQAVAEVRSAVDLDADQRNRLAKALEAATGKQVTVRVVVDPDVVGGLVVSLGDTVIDGSVARRLADLRASLTTA